MVSRILTSFEAKKGFAESRTVALVTPQGPPLGGGTTMTLPKKPFYSVQQLWHSAWAVVSLSRGESGPREKRPLGAL